MLPHQNPVYLIGSGSGIDSNAPPVLVSTQSLAPAITRTNLSEQGDLYGECKN